MGGLGGVVEPGDFGGEGGGGEGGEVGGEEGGEEGEGWERRVGGGGRGRTGRGHCWIGDGGDCSGLTVPIDGRRSIQIDRM